MKFKDKRIFKNASIFAFINIAISLILGTFFPGKHYFYPFFSWKVFKAPTEEITSYFITINDRRMPKAFDRKKRKQWINLEEQLALSVYNKDEERTQRAHKRFQNFLALQNVTPHCPVIIKKYTYNPQETLQNGQLPKGIIVREIPCQR